MTKLKYLRILPPVGAMVLIASLAVFCTAGCSRTDVEAPKEEPKSALPEYSRLRDSKHFENLEAARAAYLAESKERKRIVAEMEKLIAEARAALGEGATDEAVLAELEGNSGKYPRWKALWEENLVAVERLEAKQREAFAVLGSRMRQEVEDSKKEGGQK